MYLRQTLMKVNEAKQVLPSRSQYKTPACLEVYMH